MDRSSAFNMRGLDADALDSAGEAARRAGMTLGEWLGGAIREQAAGRDTPPRPEQRASRPPADTRPEVPIAPRQPATPPTEAKTAQALDLVARWMQETETRQQAEERRRAEREERSIAAIKDVVSAIGKRLDGIDARIEQSGDKGLAPIREAVIRLEKRISEVAEKDRGGGERSGHLATTLLDIDQRLAALGRRLDEGAPKVDERETQRFERLETKIGSILESIDQRLTAARPARRPLGEGGLGDAVAEIRARQDDLDHDGAGHGLASRLDAVAERLERTSTRREGGVSPADIARLESEIANLASRIDTAVRRSDLPQLAALGTEIGELRRELARAQPSRTLEIVRHAIDELGQRVVAALEGFDGARIGADIAALRADLAAMGSRVDDRIGSLAEPRAKSDTALRQLREEVASLRAELAEAGPRRVLDSLKDTMAALSGRLERGLSRIGEGRGDEGATLRALRDEVAGIRGEMAQVKPDRLGEDVRRALEEMEARLAGRAGTPDPVLDGIRHEMAALAQRVDRAARGSASEATLATLRDELSSLRAELGGLNPDRVADDVRRGFAELEARLTAARGTGADEAFKALRAEIGQLGQRVDRAAKGVATEAALDSLRDEVESLRANLAAARPDRLADDMRRALEDMEARLSAQRVVPTNDDALDALRHEIASLAQRVDRAARSGTSDETVRTLREDIAQLRAAALESAPREATTAIRGVLDDLSDRLESAQKAFATALSRDMRAMMADLRASIEQAPRGAALAGGLDAGLDQRIGALTDKIDVLSGLAPDAGAVAQLARHVADLRELIGNGEGSSALSGLDSRLDTLAKRFDSIEGRLIAMPAPAESGEISRAAEELRQIARGIDPSRAFAALETRLGQLDGKLDAVGKRLDSTPVAAGAKGDQAALAEMVRQLVAKMDQARGPDIDGGALAALERQVAQLAIKLDRSGLGPDLAPLERSLSDLFVQFDELRRSTHDAAETAARQAAESVAGSWSRGGEGGSSSALDAMREELATLARSRGDVDKRAQQTLETVHAALEKVVDRLGRLEAQPIATRSAAMAAAPALTPAPAVTAASLSMTRKGAPPVEAPAPEPEAPSTAAPATPSAKVPFWRVLGRKSEAKAGEEPAVEAAAPLLPAGAVPASRLAALAKGTTPLGMADMPLEPGTGRPRPLPVGEQPAPNADSKANFIAAARRAAQTAAAEAGAAKTKARPVPEAEKATGTDGPVAGGVRSFVEARKRPIMLGIAALFVALATLQVVRNVWGPLHEPTIEIPAAAPTSLGTEKPDAPPAPPAPPADAPAAPAAPPPGTPPATDSIAPPAAPAGRPRGASLVAPSDPLTVGALSPLGPQILPPATLGGPPSPTQTLGGLPELPLGIGGQFLRDAALKGDPLAAFEVANRLSDGKMVRRDLQLALRWFEKAAGEGFAPAQFRLGSMFEKGIGVTRDPRMARTWYERAATKGNAKAMHNLAVLLAEGVDGKPDYAAAAEWFRKASDLGVRDSQYNLAILLARGLGVGQNLADSYMWFAVAADQGDEEAGRKREEVSRRLSADDLARAKQKVAGFKPLPQEPIANDVSAPAGGWDAPPKAPPSAAKPVGKGKPGGAG